MSLEEVNGSSSNNGLTRFLMKVKENLDLAEGEASGDSGASVVPSVEFHYDFDYKPKFQNDKVVYSYNDLLKINEELSEEQALQISACLPSKKFWRLPVSGANQSNRRSMNKTQEDRNAKGGRNRNNRNKRQGKKIDKDSNEEFMALEEQMESTGNPMADFENWKNKMKELERRKKGLEGQQSVTTDSSSVPAQSFSSISDFFNLKSDDVTKQVSLEDLETSSQTNSEDIQGSSLNKTGSSRFSSFFQAGSSSPEDHQIAKPPSVSSEDNRPAAGSRLLSLFNSSSSNVADDKKVSPSEKDVSENISNRSSITNQRKENDNNANTNKNNNNGNGSLFLKNLISKSNANENQQINTPSTASNPTAPPGLSQNQRPPHGQPQQPRNFHQNQPAQQRSKIPSQNLQQQAGVVQPSQNFPIGIPPHMIPPPMGMPPQHFAGGYGMPPPPPPGIMQPQLLGSGGNGSQEQFVNHPNHPRNDKSHQQQHQQQQHQQQQHQQHQQHQQQQQQQNYMMPGTMSMNYNGQNMVAPPQGFPPNAFPYGHPMMHPQFQQQQHQQQLQQQQLLQSQQLQGQPRQNQHHQQYSNHQNNARPKN